MYAIGNMIIIFFRNLVYNLGLFVRLINQYKILLKINTTLKSWKVYDNLNSISEIFDVLL